MRETQKMRPGIQRLLPFCRCCALLALLGGFLNACGGGSAGGAAATEVASSSAASSSGSSTGTGSTTSTGTTGTSTPGSTTGSGAPSASSGSSTGSSSASPAVSTLTLTLPAQGLGPAVIVVQGDATSEAIASYYQSKRGIPEANIIRVNLPTRSDAMSAADFAVLKADLDAKLPSGVQATLLTWTAPSRVAGSCSMGITSALALGFDAKYCGSGCTTTAASAYFDSESARPWSSHGIRPSMMLGASTLAAAQALIDRGASADASYPTGDGYVLRTSDAARSVRYPDYSKLPTLWPGSTGLQISYQDNSTGTSSDTVQSKPHVLFYFTGLAQVAGITSNSYVPGAAADHLTSYGARLPNGNGQMLVTAWLDAGATASYGTVDEPCNYTQKFSQASVLMDHYYRGDTLLEAYWKSVQWPGQGLFVGEPLAQPFRNSASLAIVAGQYAISTRGLRPGSHYSLEYRIAPSSTWTTLASFTGSRSQPVTLSAPLPPASATHLRWVGPCAADASQQCTLSSSS
ncbi:MAG: TIGR03790 family protein [Rhodoferax sp.]|nr:TIGR03790 family protein [Rhodoferax sp.]